jgi:hypothetical protein
MALLASLLFFLVALVASGLALLVTVRIGFGRLESAIGIARDGPRRGGAAPKWHALDDRGQERNVPNRSRWQLLVFADHCLQSFPDLITAMNRFQAEPVAFEVIVVARGSAHLVRTAAGTLGNAVPIVSVDQAFYDRHNVRVMPYAVLVDDQGIVRWTGIANHEGQLRHALRMARGDNAAIHPLPGSQGVPEG